jgi:hypothetical protein
MRAPHSSHGSDRISVLSVDGWPMLPLLQQLFRGSVERPHCPPTGPFGPHDNLSIPPPAVRRHGERRTDPAEVKETVMRYLCVFKGEEGVPPSAELQAEMGKLIGEMVQAGVLLSTEGCQPSAKGFRMRRTGKRITVTDGPFTESKEVIGGFALIQVTSRDEAIEWCTRFLNVVGDGESEIRLLHENPAV